MKKLLRRWNWFFGIILFSFVVLLSGCHKKSVAANPVPLPPPPSPTALLAATPAHIEAGQSATLMWEAGNATDITLDGEPVNGIGTRRVTPEGSTTYLLIAKGPGGKQEVTVRITVTQPAVSAPAPTLSGDERFAQK